MYNDNVYPLTGQAFRPGVKSIVEKNERSKEQIVEQLPLVKEVLAHLDKQIAFYDSVNSVPDEVLLKPEEFMHLIAANKLTVQNLRAEKGFIESKIKSLK